MPLCPICQSPFESPENEEVSANCRQSAQSPIVDELVDAAFASDGAADLDTIDHRFLGLEKPLGGGESPVAPDPAA